MFDKLRFTLRKASNFDTMIPVQMQSWMPFGTPYDLFSVMHFSSHAFSKNKKPTITPKDDKVGHCCLQLFHFYFYLIV